MDSTEVDLNQMITWMIVGGVILIVLMTIILLWVNVARNKNAYREGYQWALDVHQLTADRVDERLLQTSVRTVTPKAAPIWVRGYRDALKAHDLPLSERDTTEIHNNPYLLDDAVRATTAAQDNVANSIRYQQ